MWNVNAKVNFKIETFVSFSTENWEFPFLMGQMNAR